MGIAFGFCFASKPRDVGGKRCDGRDSIEGKSHVEKTSGVWVDREYVGYLKELKGSKKILLLPGEHLVTVRQDGYQDFTQRVVLQPGQKEVVDVAMERALTGPLPSVTATVKIAVNPSRAAVFLDGLFVGHVGEFEGAGRGILVAPGTHQIRITLPGYQVFETAINPIANQKVEIKTDLVKKWRSSDRTPSQDGYRGTLRRRLSPAPVMQRRLQRVEVYAEKHSKSG